MSYPVVVAPVMRVDRRITETVRRMRSKAAERDAAIGRVFAVRGGRFAEVWPGFFSERFPTSMVANFVDVAARDFAANLAPLPSLACSAGTMRSEADKRRAEKRNRIGAYYWECSGLGTQMEWGADQYISYGFLPCYVEADHDRAMPIMHIEDPKGAYFTLDRYLRVREYARCWKQSRSELAVQYPEYAEAIMHRRGRDGYRGEDIEVIRFVDDYRVTLYLPDCGDLILAAYPHLMPYCPVSMAIRPGVSRDPRGQFDDVLWTQLASIVMAGLTVEAGYKSVQAPIAVPTDMQDLPIGPDALYRTNDPDKIRRVPLDVPGAVFALAEQFHEEMSTGAGLPDSRLGEAPPGGTTGRGVSALQGGYSTQISQGQRMLGTMMLKRATEMCFDMDRIYWPRRVKTINGTISNESFQVTYTPGRDITDDVRCDVSYGFSAGQSTSATIITMLQLRGDGIIGRDTFRRNLPFPIDVDQQQRELDVQQMEDGLKQGLVSGLGVIGQMVAAGQLATANQFITAAVDVIAGRRRGRDLSDIITEAFTPPPAPPQPELEPGEQAPGVPAPPGGPASSGGPALPAGSGAVPSVTDLAAGFLANGTPNASATVRRHVPG